jgi:pilus assembly protein Flp/PilA
LIGKGLELFTGIRLTPGREGVPPDSPVPKALQNQLAESFLMGTLGFNTDSFNNLPMISLNSGKRLSRTKGRGNRRDMKNLILKLRILADTRGQDLIEYALMAGFVAVAAGAIMPGVASSISTIFSKIASVMSNASTQGS